MIFYKENLDELKHDMIQCKKMLYKIKKFDEGKIVFQHHLVSLKDDDIKKELKKMDIPDVGSSKINFDYPIYWLRLSKENLNFAIENIHFTIALDGTIIWK